MARPAVYTAIILGAGTLLTASMTTASATPPASAQAAPRTVTQQSVPVLVDCTFRSHTQPENFILACGDGNSRLVAMHWSQWGPTAATAVGVNVVNDCKPYCAAGTFHGYPVVIRLERPQPWKRDPRVEHFTQLSLTYTDTRPEGYNRVMTVPLWD